MIVITTAKITFAALLIAATVFSISKLKENITEIRKTYVNAPRHSDADISDKFKYMQMKYRDPRTGKIPDNIRSKELAFISTIPSYFHYSKSGLNRSLQNTWVRRGPVNIGGRTRAIALDIRNEDLVLAGGVSGGMWRSTNAGVSWIQSTRKDQLSSVSCITQDTRKGKEDIWYYGTGEFYGNSASLLGNGIFKSTDNGLTWNKLESTINGNPVAWDNQFDYIWTIIADHTNESKDIVYAAFSLGGISRSTDGGITWSNVLGGFANGRSYVTDIAITPNGTLYATLSEFAYNGVSSVTKGIFRSVDGINWTDITPADMPPKYNRVVIGIAPSNENIVYFAAETPGSGHLTYRSDGEKMWHSFWKYTYISGDGSGTGGVWENRSDNLPYSDQDIREQFNSQQGYNLSLKVHPTNPDMVFLSGTNLYRSDNGFGTSNSYKWIGGYGRSIPGQDYQEYPNHHPDVHSLFFSYKDPNVLYTGSDGGIHRTDNCTADSVVYNDLNKGYYTTQYYAIALDHKEGSTKIAGGLQDNTTLVSFSDNTNDKWWTVTKGDGFNCQFVDGGELLYSSRNSMSQPKIRIYRTQFDNEGNTLNQRRIDPVGGADFIWNTPLILDPNNQNRMYLAGGRVVWRNNDLNSIPFDNSRDSTSIGWDSLTYTYVPEETITAISISRKPANTLYYGTSDGKVFKIVDAHLGNPKPIEITGDNFQSAYTSCIAIDPDNASDVFAVFSNYGVISIFHSQNGGVSWTPVSGNLEQLPNGAGSGPAVNWLSIINVNNKKMYLAATSSGLFMTAFLDEEYTIWAPASEDVVGNVPVDMLDVRHSDNLVAAGTHGNGVYSSFIKDIPLAPSKTKLLSPANDTGGVRKNVLFRWESVPGAISYTLQLSLNEDFSMLVEERKGIYNPETYLSIPEEVQNLYFWRVFAVNAGGYSEPSDSWSFLSAPAPPELIFPEHTSKDIPIDTELKWGFMPCCSAYHVQISKSLSFGSRIVADTILSATSLELKGLEPGKRHYWRVASVDGWGEGDFSGTFNFTTVDVISVDETEQGGGLHTLSISPNPVSYIAIIDIKSDVSCEAGLGIYTITGEEKFYKNQKLDKGPNHIPINLSSL